MVVWAAFGFFAAVLRRVDRQPRLFASAGGGGSGVSEFCVKVWPAHGWNCATVLKQEKLLISNDSYPMRAAILVCMSEKMIGIVLSLQMRIDQLRSDIANIEHAIGSKLDESDPQVRRLKSLENALDLEKSKKRVVLFGIEHGCEVDGSSKNGELGSRLKFLIESFGVTTLMEEWTEEREPSYPSRIFPEIEYKNVGTPQDDEFLTYQCHQIDHPAHEGILGPCEEAPSMSEYGPLDKQENRERQMTRNVIEQMAHHHVGLIILGLAHLHSMSLKLKEAGFNVTAYAWLG